MCASEQDVSWAAVCGAGIYRREGWEVPLGAALLELRECASRLKLPEVAQPRVAPHSTVAVTSCTCIPVLGEDPINPRKF